MAELNKRKYSVIKTVALIIMCCSATFLTEWIFMSKQFERRLLSERSNQAIINYFNEICLGSELGWSPPITVKTKGTTMLYIFKKDLCEEQVNFVKIVVGQFNALSTDGSKIQLTQDSSIATSYLYLYPLKKIKDNPSFKYLDSNYYGQFNTKQKYNYIINARIFINTDKTLEMQKVAILEELIQSMGLFRDSESYPNSIFYQDKYSAHLKTLTLSDMDKKLVQLLYNPKMKVGLNRDQTTDVIREILENK
jgi:hypothetical protein